MKWIKKNIRIDNISENEEIELLIKLSQINKIYFKRKQFLPLQKWNQHSL